MCTYYIVCMYVLYTYICIYIQMTRPNFDWLVFFKSVFMLGVARHGKYFIARNVAMLRI